MRANKQQQTNLLFEITRAIMALGSALLTHVESATLRERLRTGELKAQEFYDQVLCLVYRRALTDLIEARGLPLPASFLFTSRAIPDLAPCSPEALQQTLPALSCRALTVSDLAHVYEALLEMQPRVDLDTGSFTLLNTTGRARKTSGSYYTPPELVSALLDSTLDPVLARACTKSDAEAALLALRICDPACGCGHFLVAAAQRMATRLAALRCGEDLDEAVRRAALRDVLACCIYGVDIDPLAAELCRLNLWLEAADPALSFAALEAHIRCGNSLIGVTPALLARGIPDGAFVPLPGDNGRLCGAYKKRNQEQRARSHTEADTFLDLSRASTPLEEGADAWCAAFVWRKSLDLPDAITEDVLRTATTQPALLAPWMRAEIRRLARQYRFFHWHLAFPEVFRLPADDERPENERAGWSGGFDVLLGNPPWERIKLQEREWLAARCPDIAHVATAAVRRRLLAQLAEADAREPGAGLFAEFQQALRQAAGESHFVRHSQRYPLSGHGDINACALFVEAMLLLARSGGRVGCIVPSGIVTGDTLKHFLQDLLARGALVSLFDFENRRGIFPGVQGNVRFCLLTLAAESRSHFTAAAQLDNPALLKEPARRYTLSQEIIRLINPNTLSCPTFASARDAELIISLYRRLPIFCSESTRQDNAWNIAFLRMFDMTNNSRLFRTLEELRAAGWRLDDAGNIFTRGEERYLPLYEAKLVDQYNHRSATFADIAPSIRFKMHAATCALSPADLADPALTVLPRYWVAETECRRRLPGAARWMLGFRNAMSAVADTRSLVAAILPSAGVGNSLPLLLCGDQAQKACLLLAVLNSCVLDYVLRQKCSTSNLNFYVLRQLPFPAPRAFFQHHAWAGGALAAWILPRVLELTCTARDLAPFAHDCGYAGPPFRWNEERRLLLRCELDAACFALYGVSEADAAYILDTFAAVRRREERAWGEYRSKRLILEIYAEIQRAARAGLPYATRLDPPPVTLRLRYGDLP